MSDPTQNPPPEEPGGNPAPPPPPPSQSGYGAPPPPPGPGAYPPPPPGDYGTGPAGGYQPMGPPPMAPVGGVGQPADLMPRFLARLIDYILLAVVNAVIVGFIVVGVLMGDNDGTTSIWTGDASYAVSAVSSIVSAAIYLAYFALMESSRGQTLGKMLLKLETRGPDGGRPTMEQALRRNAFTAIGVLGVVPYLGFVSSLLSLAAVITIAVTISNNSATRRGWHDNFAGGTTVVKVG